MIPLIRITEQLHFCLNNSAVGSLHFTQPFHCKVPAISNFDMKAFVPACSMIFKSLRKRGVVMYNNGVSICCIKLRLILFTSTKKHGIDYDPSLCTEGAIPYKEDFPYEESSLQH